MSNPPLSQIEEIARVLFEATGRGTWDNAKDIAARGGLAAKSIVDEYTVLARAILPFITAARAGGAKDMREQAARMTRELAIEMRDHRCDGSAFVDAAARKIAALPITQENEQ